MDPHVVEKRRKSLEEYVTRIVQRLPTVSFSFLLISLLLLFSSLHLSYSASLLLSSSPSKKNLCNLKKLIIIARLLSHSLQQTFKRSVHHLTA
jgi:hypothetical protein